MTMLTKSHLEKPVTPGGAGTDTTAIHDNEYIVLTVYQELDI